MFSRLVYLRNHRQTVHHLYDEDPEIPRNNQRMAREKVKVVILKYSRRSSTSGRAHRDGRAPGNSGKPARNFWNPGAGDRGGGEKCTFYSLRFLEI